MSERQPGLSVRVKLTLSYVGFLMLAGALLLAVVWVFLLRYVPDEYTTGPGPWSPNRTELWEAFAPRAAQALVALLVVALVGGWWLAGRMLAPLDRITQATRIAGSGKLSHRVALEGPNDEFRELADAFDRMLERLEAHADEQRRFAANASHELRTPLAITQALLDVARQETHRDHAEVLDRLDVVNTRAIDLTEALLVLSRAEAGSFARESVDLSLLAEQAAETLLPLAERRGVEVTTTGEAAMVGGNPALLQQLVTNLVHNAIVHNLPEGGTVEVSTGVGPREASVVVENTGPLLDAATVAILVEPFQRGSERTRSTSTSSSTETGQPGVGLGLAIVRSIADTHHAQLDVVPRDGGGLRVTVTLPLDPH